jgi:acyl-CoA reductase-like NAD-dependent aldehyde dehydrogenase
MLYIDGIWRDAASARTFESFNPATGEVLGTAADAGGSDAAEAVAAAARAFRS